MDIQTIIILTVVAAAGHSGAERLPEIVGRNQHGDSGAAVQPRGLQGEHEVVFGGQVPVTPPWPRSGSDRTARPASSRKAAKDRLQLN